MILHTITCTRYVPSMGAHEQFTRHLTRPYGLTVRGIQRMFSKGCPEYQACPEISVTHVSKATCQ